MRVNYRLTLMGVVAIAMATTAKAESLIFSTGNPNGLMATASRPASAGLSEIESADDFVLTQETKIDSASFTGLLTGTSPSIGNVVVEIYRVFPADWNVGRTSGPPDFSTDRVPTRVNSPSDVALESRDSASSTLNLTTSSLGAFTALNSVQPGGIHPKPGQTTGGDGSVTGQEITFNTSFTNPFDLQAGHYFFVPQVEVTGGGNFLWLSAPKPIVPPGTPFPPGNTDLQSWTRDDPGLNPDWLRVGTDIVGGSPAPTFNASFSLSGNAVPEPSSLVMGGTAALAGLGYWGWRRRPRVLA